MPTGRGGSADGPGYRAAIDRRDFIGAVGGAAVATGIGSRGASASTEPDGTDYEITARDGATIAATLFEPDVPGPVPAILMTHGWGLFRGSPLLLNKARRYLEAGYAVLAYDSRGFGQSSGTVDLAGPKDVADVGTLLDWLADRDGIRTDAPGDPVVGMDGISYAAGIQLQAAAHEDRIDAIVPRMGWYDLAASLVPRGVVKSGWLTLLVAFGEVATWDFDPASMLGEDLWEWYLRAVVTNELPAAAREAFEERSIASKLDRLDTPTLVMAGWQDSLFPAGQGLALFDELRARDVPTGLVLFQGGHALEHVLLSPAERARLNDRAITWMDHHLRGEGDGGPTVTTHLDGLDRWRTGEEFPVRSVDRRTFDLRAAADGRTTELEKNVWWWDDPVAAYTWPVEADLEVVGQPTIDLGLWVDGPEARLFCGFVVERGGDLTTPLVPVTAPRRVEGEGRHDVRIEFPPVQEYLRAGDELGFVVSVTHPFYFDSRTADGVWIDNEASSVGIPRRHLEGGAVPQGRLESGMEVHVAARSTRTRWEPGGWRRETLRRYESGEIVDGPETADGRAWWEVRWYEDGRGGWVPADAIRPGAVAVDGKWPGATVTADTGWFEDLEVRPAPGASTVRTEVDDGTPGRILDGPAWTAPPDGDTPTDWWRLAFDGAAGGWARGGDLSRD